VLTRENVEERRLAGSVRPGDPENVPALDRERDPVHGDEAAVPRPHISRGERQAALFSFSFSSDSGC
jgi:hypothetical protein